MPGRRVKIVLPCSNEGPWLRVTIDSILETTRFPDFEILVLANGDRETDFRFAGQPPYRNRVRVTEVAEALGVGRSVNRAVEPGDADYYVFLDAHCLIEEASWLEQVVSVLEEFPDASMVQPEVVQFTYDRKLEPDSGLDPACIRKTLSAYSIRWTWPYKEYWELAEVETLPASSQPYEAMAGGGMATFVRSETFHRLGRYDPEVDGWYPETMDYCVRAWLLGLPMVVDPRIRVFHRVQTGAGSSPARHMVHGMLRTCYKYLKPRRRDLAELLFRRHGLDEVVDWALERIRRGRWLDERAESLRLRTHDDDWLFSKFEIEEG